MRHAVIDISFQNVSKLYELRDSAATNPTVALTRMFVRRARSFWALRDVSFEVSRGELLGIIGANGAGKSTILKLLSRITSPTRGEIKVWGRLSALIEVGSGFHPELSGRENIYLSGSILGMRRREIKQKLDSIVDFAGIDEFIDTPVKRYSSGMYVRLGFSIAAHLDADVLLLDEVLAVGDASFQSKCLRRINELKTGGKTIVFISHDLTTVSALCKRVLLLESGAIIADGPASEVVALYERQSKDKEQPHNAEAESAVDIIRVMLRDERGREAALMYTGAPLTIHIDYVVNEAMPDAVFEIFCYSPDRRLAFQLSTASSGGILLEPGPGAIEFNCDELGLQPGNYYMDATVKRQKDRAEISWSYRCATLRVDSDKPLAGGFYMPHSWSISRSSRTAWDSNGIELTTRDNGTELRNALSERH